MKLTLEVWRQESRAAAGRFETYEVTDATPEMTLLELIDRLNDQLVSEDRDPVAFESDCREGICGSCGMNVDGKPHGPQDNTPSCEQHVRSFRDGERVVLEPFRSETFPVIRDLIVDRSALDRVIQAGGHVAVDAGTAPDADVMLVNVETAERALDFAACIGCGACVAACPNGAAHLFTGSKLAHLAAAAPGQAGARHTGREHDQPDGVRVRTVLHLRRVLGGVPSGHPADGHRRDQQGADAVGLPAKGQLTAVAVAPPAGLSA